MEFILTNIKQWDKICLYSGEEIWQWPLDQMVKLGIIFSALWCDLVRSTQHHLGRVLARNVLSKSIPEEPSHKFRREQFREQVAWITQRIPCHEDQRKVRRDCKVVTLSMRVWLDAELKKKSYRRHFMHKYGNMSLA